MFHKLSPIVLAAAAFAASTASAEAVRHRHHLRVAQQYNNERPPLTVNKRSFLDPGTVPAIDHGPNYVTQNTLFARTADQHFLKSQFGNEVLPAPLEVPGRPEPIVQFETPAYPY
ncbi:MAG TPA: hypothetical protein VL996_14420 [Methylocella sp.]|nr:hypothetical protein [Methylocella sp.]